ACDRTATARVLGYLFFTDAAPTGFCARSLHDALPIMGQSNFHEAGVLRASGRRTPLLPAPSIQGVRPQPASLRELARRLAARPPLRQQTSTFEFRVPSLSGHDRPLHEDLAAAGHPAGKGLTSNL